ncbi:AI-2E family transporter [Haloquadratum walsbyi]|uniref:AI-2E family transport protein n=1 Tax=Haloquadratum walsbyi (strain DSM 16854 / JCM 12705 / C23) TaxID=768065 RepID=G0LMJ1_HALWC|nr:AI-2E family transporter [Haloquadratum walsbyi]CCC41311.1 AI-2E family transport protein [Haloquadratum walsbyi C23]
MNARRFAVALFGLAVFSVIGFLAYEFIAPLTIAVFLYYSTRKYYTLLERFRLPASIRAAIALGSLAIPLIFLVSYAGVLLVLEARAFIDEYDLISVAAENVSWFGSVSRVPEFTVQGLYNAYQSGQLTPLIDFATAHASVLTSMISQFTLNLFIITIVTYYLLVDGDKIGAWLLRFDDEAIIREYLEAADRELESVLFGNLLNVLSISLIAIGVFNVYNVFVPSPAEVPYPALAGGLTGIASLIPVVGMKIVYFPLTILSAVPILLGGNPSNLTYIAGLLVIAIVVIDTIPDIVLRPLLSGDETHVGLLMLAYTLGPVVLGFYGLFFAPILLVIGLTFANTALPRLLNTANNADTTPSPSGVNPTSNSDESLSSPAAND